MADIPPPTQGDRERDLAAEYRLIRKAAGSDAPGDLTSLGREFALGLLRRCHAAEAARDKLQAFKAWTHAYLDAQGVPHHPPGTHGAEGCRIGDRMDWLMACLRDTEAAQARLRAAVLAIFSPDQWPDILDALQAKGDEDNTLMEVKCTAGEVRAIHAALNLET